MPDPFAQPRSAYVHVPFCAHRCGYCEFTVIAGRDDLVGDYRRALECELSLLGAPHPVDTLFLGGGTPTHPSADDLAGLLQLVRHWLPPAPEAELTVEANPDDLTAEKIAVLASAGITRVSLGVQSFDAAALRTLERTHAPGDVVAAVRRLQPVIPNVSLDLIFGVPGQTLAAWSQTLAQAVELGPTHVSTYGLTYEKGAAFWSRREKGVLVPVADELEREMYAAAMDELTSAGYEQYEISSFARPGYRCRHNQVYWSGAPYLAFGPGAARYLDGRRETNVRSVTGWMRRVLAGESPVGEEETLSDEDRARELLVLGLRRVEGVGHQTFQTQTGYHLQELAADAIRQHVAAGNLIDDGRRVRLTRNGRFLADSVVVDLL